VLASEWGSEIGCQRTAGALLHVQAWFVSSGGCEKEASTIAFGLVRLVKNERKIIVRNCRGRCGQEQTVVRQITEPLLDGVTWYSHLDTHLTDYIIISD
jgi:hypothetical protein